MGDNAVFAVAVGQVVGSRHAAPWAEHWIAIRLLGYVLGCGTSHGSTVAVGTMSARAVLWIIPLLRVTGGEPTSYTGESARVALL
jgi:hypothetical protein